MKLEQFRSLVNEAVRDGYIFEFEQERTMLSTAEGHNRAGVAVLGALILNLGRPTFNTYCENQRRATGWLQSKTNPIQAEARDLRAKCRNDPSVRSMFEDVEREFVAPLVAEHVKNGGQAPSAGQVEATCSMLLAKILWDSKLGNPDLAAALRMLGAGLRAEAPAPTAVAGFEALEALRRKKSLTLIEAVDLTSAEMFFEAVAKVRASIGEGLFKEVLGENPDSFNKEAHDLVAELMIFCLLLADRISFHALGPERRAKFMDFLVVNVGSSLPASSLQDPSQEAISAYERDFFNLYSRRSKALARFDLPTKRTRGDDVFAEAARIIAKELYAGSGQHDEFFAAKMFELILVDWKSMRALSARLAGIQDWEEAHIHLGTQSPTDDIGWTGIADEKGEFSVILVSVGERRIEVFKEVRAITGLSRKGVNELLDGAPEPVKERITRARAEEIKKRLEEAGATVQIKHRN